MDGALVFCGRFDVALWIVTVALEAAVDDPSAFDAVTRTRSRLPTSAEARTYAEVVAPPMVAQLEPSPLPPEGGQRTHWYAYVIGAVPVQVPVVAVSVEPSVVVPFVRGSTVFFGAAWITARAEPLASAAAPIDAAAAASAAAVRIRRHALPVRGVLSSVITSLLRKATDTIYPFATQSRRSLTASLRLGAASLHPLDAALTVTPCWLPSHDDELFPAKAPAADRRGAA